MDNAEQLALAREKAAEANKGNTNSSKNNRLLKETLHRVLIQEEALKTRQIVEALVAKAADGDISAIKEVFDRYEGKAAQSVTVSGDEEKPLITKVIREIVRPKDSNG